MIVLISSAQSLLVFVLYKDTRGCWLSAFFLLQYIQNANKEIGQSLFMACICSNIYILEILLPTLYKTTTDIIIIRHDPFLLPNLATLIPKY